MASNAGNNSFLTQARAAQQLQQGSSSGVPQIFQVEVAGTMRELKVLVQEGPRGKLNTFNRSQLNATLTKHGARLESSEPRSDIAIYHPDADDKELRYLCSRAQKLPRQLPVVHPDWVHACIEAGQLLDPADPAWDCYTRCDIDRANPLGMYGAGMQAGKYRPTNGNTRNLYTYEDRAFIVKHLVDTPNLAPQGNKIAEELARLRPRHTASSYQTWISGNWTLGHCLSDKVEEEKRRRNLDARALNQALMPRSHTQNAAPRDAPASAVKAAHIQGQQPARIQDDARRGILDARAIPAPIAPLRPTQSTGLPAPEAMPAPIPAQQAAQAQPQRPSEVEDEQRHARTVDEANPPRDPPPDTPSRAPEQATEPTVGQAAVQAEDADSSEPEDTNKWSDSGSLPFSTNRNQTQASQGPPAKRRRANPLPIPSFSQSSVAPTQGDRAFAPAFGDEGDISDESDESAIDLSPRRAAGSTSGNRRASVVQHTAYETPNDAQRALEEEERQRATEHALFDGVSQVPIPEDNIERSQPAASLGASSTEQASGVSSRNGVFMPSASAANSRESEPNLTTQERQQAVEHALFDGISQIPIPEDALLDSQATVSTIQRTDSTQEAGPSPHAQGHANQPSAPTSSFGLPAPNEIADSSQRNSNVDDEEMDELEDEVEEPLPAAASVALETNELHSRNRTEDRPSQSAEHTQDDSNATPPPKMDVEDSHTSDPVASNAKAAAPGSPVHNSDNSVESVVFLRGQSPKVAPVIQQSQHEGDSQSNDSTDSVPLAAVTAKAHPERQQSVADDDSQSNDSTDSVPLAAVTAKARPERQQSAAPSTPAKQSMRLSEVAGVRSRQHTPMPASTPNRRNANSAGRPASEASTAESPLPAAQKPGCNPSPRKGNVPAPPVASTSALPARKPSFVEGPSVSPHQDEGVRTRAGSNAGTRSPSHRRVTPHAETSSEGQRLSSAPDEPRRSSSKLLRSFSSTSNLFAAGSQRDSPVAGANVSTGSASTLRQRAEQMELKAAYCRLADDYGFKDLPQLKPYVDQDKARAKDLRHLNHLIETHFYEIARSFGCELADVIDAVRESDGNIELALQKLDNWSKPEDQRLGARGGNVSKLEDL
ncbi:hypothetical protein V8E36_006347 [Tilletia maclaganii]